MRLVRPAASNSALTKEFMHSRYVIVWPMVDKKMKLYHYAEEWTNDVFSWNDAFRLWKYKNN